MKQVIQCCYGTHKSSGFVIKQLHPHAFSTISCRHVRTCVQHCDAKHVQAQSGVSLLCVCCSPNVRVRVSLGGTSPKLLAMALDILGAVVPCPAPGPSSSPKSAEGAPERVLPAAGDGKLPAGHNLFRIVCLCGLQACFELQSTVRIDHRKDRICF